ncbi:MAG TPA: DUF6519 domain-containing protein, partial [Thermoanaerobaculia bacterium]|nr:DUF6519 domain-containing protein [Thermoanaerobaculia bacterium]
MKRGSLEGDFSRIPSDPDRGYSGVRMQQGRVQLDADWNAQVDILTHGLDTALQDVIGAHGGPEGNAGFAVEPMAALRFDGGLRHVEVAPAHDFAFPGTTPFALAVQVWPRPGGGGGTVLSRLTAGREAQGYRLSVLPDGRVAFTRHGQAAGELVTAQAIPSGRFTAVGVACDAGEVRLYLGGALAARAPRPAELPAVDAPLLFGAAPGVREVMSCFDGLLADVRIWASAAPAALGGAAPLAWWPMDEGRGDVLHDRMGFQPGVLRGGSADAWTLYDLRLGAGRYYVCGVPCVNPTTALYTEQWAYPGAPLPPDSGRFLVYLEVWQRTVTWIQDAALREVALGGPDTTVRSQTVAQVKIRPLERDDDGAALPAAVAPGRMSARRGAVGTLGNDLYRIEIHDAGWGRQTGGLGAPTCKWSRRNGAVAYPIAPVRPGAQEVFLAAASGFERELKAGDWIEILDDAAVLRSAANPLVQIEQVDTAVPRLALLQPVPDGVGQEAELHPFLRLWNQEGDDESGGTVPIQPGAWIDLEDGVQVCFDGDGYYATGDYWCVPARTLTGDVEWPRRDGAPDALPPLGIGRCGCPLALLELDGDGVRLYDRRRLFPPLTRIPEGGDGIPSGLCVLSEAPSPPPGWTATGYYVTAPSLCRGWTTRELPFPDVCWLAAAEVEGQVYLFTESAVWHWDPARPERAPSRLGPVPGPRRDFAVAARRGRIHAAGGFHLETGESSAAHDEYDPCTGAWCPRAPLPSPRGALALVNLGGNLHALGGRYDRSTGGAGGGLLDLHDVYRPER